MDVKKSQAHLLEDLVIAWLNAEPHRIPSIRDSQEHMVFSICFELIKQFKIYISASSNDQETKLFQLDSNGIESAEAVLFLDSIKYL